MDGIALTTGIILAVCVLLWARRPFGLPFSVTALVFLAACVCLGVPAAAAFSGFASGAFWTLVPALFFGFALVHTGLGKRIAYFLLMLVKKPTLPKLLVVFFIAGLILSLLTPSMTVRVVIISPIAAGFADLCGFGKGTKERSVLLITVWIAAVVPGTAWLTGSLNGPIISGMFEGVGLGAIAFSDWARASLLPVLLAVVLTAVFGYLAVRPEGKLAVDRSVFVSAYTGIGPVKKSEVVTAFVLVCCFAMFSTRAIHGVPDAVVCIAGLAVLFVFGVIGADDIGTGISWDLALFLGALLGFSTVYEQTGLSSMLIGIVSPAVAPVAGSSPGLFLILAAVVLFLWRFVDIATFIPTFAIVVTMLPGFAHDFGISPLVWLPILSLAQNTFFMSYTNLFALIAERNMGEAGWDRKTFSKYSFVYCAAALAGLAVSLPYWSAQGLIG